MMNIDVDWVLGEIRAGSSITDIAYVAGVDRSLISYISTHQKLPPKEKFEEVEREKRSEIKQAGKRLALSTYKNEQSEFESLKRTMQLAQARINQLEAMRAITFEYDNTAKKVTISGVDRLFLAHEGLPKFREWLVKTFSVE